MPLEYGSAPAGEKIATAAINVDGRVFTGPTHSHAIESAERALGMPLAQMHDASIGDGFVTNAGRYVSRWEAEDIARRASQGQARGKFGATRGLASEDTAMSGITQPLNSIQRSETATIFQQALPLSWGPASRCMPWAKQQCHQKTTTISGTLGDAATPYRASDESRAADANQSPGTRRQ